MKQERHIGIVIASIALAVSTHAYGHVGAGESAGFIHGFVHPFDGIDHLLIMVAGFLSGTVLLQLVGVGIGVAARAIRRRGTQSS